MNAPSNFRPALSPWRITACLLASVAFATPAIATPSTFGSAPESAIDAPGSDDPADNAAVDSSPAAESTRSVGETAVLLALAGGTGTLAIITALATSTAASFAFLSAAHRLAPNTVSPWSGLIFLLIPAMTASAGLAAPIAVGLATDLSLLFTVPGAIASVAALSTVPAFAIGGAMAALGIYAGLGLDQKDIYFTLGISYAAVGFCLGTALGLLAAPSLGFLGGAAFGGGLEFVAQEVLTE